MSLCILCFLTHANTALCMENDVGGQITFRGSYERFSEDSLFNESAGDASLARSLELRLMQDFQIDSKHLFSLHYDILGSWSELNNFDFPEDFPFKTTGGNDKRRLLDLDHQFSSHGQRIVSHRIDRLAYTMKAEWGSLTLGRSAITWGNGLVFNPMDLFNPFSPTDVERDYKTGDDLMLLDIDAAEWTGEWDVQVLFIPRRVYESGKLASNSSSLALKAHGFGDELEWDLLAARHYDESVFGAGVIGYLGSAVWRTDATVTLSDDDHTEVSFMTNMDYSWTAAGFNFYGSLEFHWNTFGTNDYRQLSSRDKLLNRIERGELHTLGRLYLAPSLQMEVHPLLNLYLTSIINLEDPSAVILPRMVWSPSQNIELTLAASLNAGSKESEFGGFSFGDNAERFESPEYLQLWIKAFF